MDLRARVKEVVDRHDLEGLLSSGAPLDEYDSEVDDLTQLVESGQATADRVRDIWDTWFGPPEEGALEALASDLAALAAPVS